MTMVKLQKLKMDVFEHEAKEQEENLFDELYVDMDKFQKTLEYDVQNFNPPVL